MLQARTVGRVGLILLIAASTVFAQFTLRGSISGTVTDSSGAVIVGANVKLADLDRQQESVAVTGSSGDYTFNNLNPGRYQVTVEQPGFKKSVSDTVSLAAEQHPRVDMTLQVGQTGEVVEVSAALPLIQAEEATVGALVERAYVEELPLEGRNFTALATLAPGVSSSPRGNYGDTWAAGGHHLIGGTNYTVGGGGDNGFYMNGVNINDNWVGGLSYAPGLEAINEVRVNVVDFSAAAGRDISNIQVSTRGGTNTLHGAIYDGFQNDGLNAWSAWDKMHMAPGQAKNVLQRNQYGFDAGGPVYIPKIFNGKDKAFFFVNLENMHENSGGSNNFYRVPTDAERNGDFSSWLTRFSGDPHYLLYDPFSTTYDDAGNSHRNPLPNNQLGGLLNADAQDMLNLFPKPNGYQDPTNPLNLSNLSIHQASIRTSYRIDMRFDYRITSRDNVYVTVSKSHGYTENQGGLFPEMPLNLDDASHVITVNYARAFSAHIANEFIFGTGMGQMLSVDQGSQDYMHRTDTLRNKYFKNLGSGADLGLYAMNIAGLPSVGSAETFMASNPTLTISDNLGIEHGSHSLKFGFSYFRKAEHDWDYWRYVNFDNAFSRAGSVPCDTPTQAGCGSLGGDGLASFLMGIPSYVQQRFKFNGNPDMNLVVPYLGFYGQDKWHVTPKLTLDIGLRWDIPIQIYSANNWGNPIMDFSYPDWQLAIPGLASGYPQHYIPASKKDFAPRLGIAYRMRNDLVARLSYGIFYNAGSMQASTRFGNAFGNAMPSYAGQILQVYNDTPTIGFGDVFPVQETVDMGYPVVTGKGTGYFTDPWRSVNVNDKHSNVSPYYQRYMAQIEKGFGTANALTLMFVGSRGADLTYDQNVNAPAYQTGWTSGDQFNAARPNNSGRWGDVWLSRAGLNSFYNGVTIQFEHRFNHGVSWITHYTFSKTVGDYGGWTWNRSLGRGELSFSHPHRFVSGLVFQPAYGSKLPGIVKAVATGWAFNAITIFQSGDALTVGNGQTSARDYEPDMPDVSANPNLSGSQRTFTNYFNTSVFAAPLEDVKGNAGVGIVRGPGTNNWDIAMSKNFHPVERMEVKFRAEMFNAFNHTQWSGVNTTYVDPSTPGSTFGWVTGAREPRVVQLNLKIGF